MRAAIVSVDYDDILSVTLPYNRHHFEEVLIVTTPGSRDAKVAANFGARVFETTAFYDNGAHFNKWKAFEQGLDWFGRKGWMALLDADILWPTKLPEQMSYHKGILYSPYRRLWLDVKENIPGENIWGALPLFQDHEFAGYTQIFHTEDPALPSGYWHDLDWNHAGGADSFFQQRWLHKNKVRPSWQVLHLGPPGRNWCGRATPRRDSLEVPGAANRRQSLQELLEARPLNLRRYGNPYQGEKLVLR